MVMNKVTIALNVSALEKCHCVESIFYCNKQESKKAKKPLYPEEAILAIKA
jgi:hypothetical protein